MNIEEYCDALNLEIELIYYPNQNGRWCANFKRTEITDTEISGVLCSAFGNGKTPEEAIAAYIEKIKGRRLVIDAMSDKRREYNVPDSLNA